MNSPLTTNKWTLTDDICQFCLGAGGEEVISYSAYCEGYPDWNPCQACEGTGLYVLPECPQDVQHEVKLIHFEGNQ